MTDRQEMLDSVSMYDFAMLDTALYLDSHPQSKSALEYYHKTHEMSQQARAAYTAKYGPLTKHDAKNEAYWSWIEDPWPWEGVDD